MDGAVWGRGYAPPDRFGVLAELRMSMALRSRRTPRWQRHERASERYVRAHRPLLAAREAALAEWHRAIGTVDVSGDPRAFAVLTGLTS